MHFRPQCKPCFSSEPEDPRFRDRVPMIVRGPGILPGQRVSALMEHVDIVPTLIDAAGLERASGLLGASLMETLRGRSAGVRDSAMTAYDAHDRGISTKCLRTSRYKLVVFAGETYGELYDLQEDPGENRNLFEDPASRELRRRMMELLVQRMIRDQDPLPVRQANW
ncbi:sulfatase family protein [Cohnella hashimotonis]